MTENYDDDPHKYYFKFDPTAWDAWLKTLYDTLNGIVEGSNNTWYVGEFPHNSFPVNSYFPSTGQNKICQYLGNNYQGSEIWKNEYFVYNPIQTSYINHIQSHPIHFIQQPHYYKGLFDILN
jgi:hypothetical protein